MAWIQNRLAVGVSLYTGVILIYQCNMDGMVGSRNTWSMGWQLHC